MTRSTRFPSFHAFAFTAVCAVAAMAPAAALAQGAAAFPGRQILFVVTSPPGGSNDTFARAIGKKLSDALGKPVVVENRPGATGSIGEGFVAKSAPDGHTLVMISSTFTTKSAIATNLPFDPQKAFTPVAMVGKGPLLLAVAPSTPYKTTEELFAFAKANPGKLNYATSGTGSINHFATELMSEAAGVKLTHVPYKGMGPATADLMAGHVQVLIASAPSMLAQVKGGKVRGLGVTTAKASSIAPGLAPVAGAGAPGYNVELWWGILAPAGTPKDVVAKLNGEINKALATDEMKEFLAREGAEAAPTSPEAFGELIRADIEKWKRVAKAADIKAD